MTEARKRKFGVIINGVSRNLFKRFFPIAAALGLGWFIYKLIMRIVDGMETKLDTVDEKVEGQIAAIEERLGTKLDSQHGILVALIDRVRSLDNEIIDKTL